MACASDTHYVAKFTTKNDQGEQRAVCGEFVPDRLVAPLGVQPRCWGCRAWFNALEADAREDRPAGRRLTRHEQLQALADSGCDTWAEARGER